MLTLPRVLYNLSHSNNRIIELDGTTSQSYKADRRTRCVTNMEVHPHC